MPIRYANKILFNEVRFILADWSLERSGISSMLFGDMDIFMFDHILDVNKEEIIKMVDMYKLESGDRIDVRGVKTPKAIRNRAVVMNISHYYK